MGCSLCYKLVAKCVIFGLILKLLLSRVIQNDFGFPILGENLSQEQDLLYRHCKTPFNVALTFDDNPDDTLPELLKLLGKYNATATFFPNAPYHFERWDLEKHVRAIHANGHQIGDHTWDHLDITTVDETRALLDINRMNSWLNYTLGIRSSYVRPPYGECLRKCQESLDRNGFKAVRWSLDTFDWQNPLSDTANASLEILESWISAQDKLPEDERTGPIVLMHARLHSTIKVIVPTLLEALSARGYRFVSVAECLGYGKEDWYY
ncbi:glycoside hydrolase/deacetylase [Corynespora cassiicola Philippines]|uniref:Glycoside hydrolase/deacetylase n=1 Tax=Corynespora cassiicola Philippines TaxID=1448308 RepID=A0A2T2N3F0_CORCC|nr:glycoside hydrolase/deacetylase [Corynespora cassiicola Philippines]